jgi:hypothetical protein
VFINRLIKYIYLVLYKEASTVEDLAYIFIKIIITNHGILIEIILDREILFIL